MKFYHKGLLLLGETAAFGWFMLRNISYLAVIPLILAGIGFCFLPAISSASLWWLNGLLAVVSVGIVSHVVSIGLLDGGGWLMLISLLLAVGVMALNIKKKEIERVSAWWALLFLAAFVFMLIGSMFSLELHWSLPEIGNWRDILIFYLLAFLEPFSLGKDYRQAPLALSVLLLPFAVVAYFVLGKGAFVMAEYPYLSVWSGVAVFSFHHTEGIILGLYYGLVAFRVVSFFSEVGEMRCKQQKAVL